MLGDLLRQTREQKNLSLDDVEKGTNIRKLYIKAIEDGNYDKLPGEVFLKGFIKTYGKFLGLDGQKLIEQYKAEKNPAVSADAEPKAQAAPPAPEPAAPDKTETVKEDKQPEKNAKPNKPAAKPVPNIDNFNDSRKYLETKNSGGSKKNIIIIAVIIIAIIAGAIAFLSSQGSDSQPAADNEPKTQQEQAPEQPAAPAPAPAPVSGSEVSAVFSQDCWTEVKVDGNTVLSETVKAGSTLNWKGNNQVEVTVGNAGAVDITFNGQAQGKMGDVGAVVTKAFTAPNATPAQQNAPAAQPPANAAAQQPTQQQNQ